MSSFVTPLIAEVTTTTLYFFLMYEMIILDIFLILSNVPTDVPPNFKTIIFIDILYLNFYIILIKYILIVKSTTNEKDTINKKEINKFSKIADEWWDPEGKFKPLHNFNPVRIKYIKDTITKKFGKKKNKSI